MDNATHMRTYLIALFGVLGVALAAVLAMNLALGARALGSAGAAREASQWQQSTKGVTYAPPISLTLPFKALRLADRLPDINAVVLGSSALMGITEAHFPPSWRIYNLTFAGNATSATAAQAEYIERTHGDRIRYLLVGLDWSVGNLYAPGMVAKADLSPQAYQRAYTDNAVPFLKRVEDALSWPRVATLGQVLVSTLRSGAPVEDLRRTLSEAGGREYRCPDGATARDFDLVNRGLCRGYRYDGSWTFANDSRVTPAQAVTLSAAAATPSSKYTKSLCSNGGAPNTAYLDHLATTARRLKASGGEMVLLLPPLVPGLEAALLQHERWRPCLEKTKSALDAWGRQHGLTLIDAGAAERWGCTSLEFADEHHAYPECNARVLKRYFSERAAGRVPAGLYQ
jgi:hypothetical protein